MKKHSSCLLLVVSASATGCTNDLDAVSGPDRAEVVDGYAQIVHAKYQAS